MQHIIAKIISQVEETQERKGLQMISDIMGGRLVMVCSVINHLEYRVRRGAKARNIRM